METEIVTRKAINFDLSIKALKEFYCKSNNPLEYLKAYNEINRFMNKHGFCHRQWSGYTSKDPVSEGDILVLITQMVKNFPWLDKCIKKFDVTDIGNQYDLTKQIHELSKSEKSIKSIEKSVTKEKTKPPPKPHSSLSQLKANAKAQIEKREQDKGQSISQNKVKNYNER